MTQGRGCWLACDSFAVYLKKSHNRVGSQESRQSANQDFWFPDAGLAGRGSLWVSAPSKFDGPGPSIFRIWCPAGWTQLCLELHLFPAGFPGGPAEECPLTQLPLSQRLGLACPCILLSSQASKEGRRPGSGPRCPHVLSPPPPPALPRAAKPVPLPDCDRQLPRLPALPVPAPRRRLHSHFLSPAGALEARPGPAALAPGGKSAESCPSLWAREAAATTARAVQASHLPPRPPPICSAG